MNHAIITAASLVLIFLAFVVQMFIPPLAAFGNAHVLLVPVFFSLAALALPFPLMIGVAFYTGLLSDLVQMHFVADQPEVGLGWSIVLYVALGSALQGVRPMFLRGHWELHAFGSGLVTILLLVAQFVMITFRRLDAGFVFNEYVIWRILVPGSIAFLVSPLVYFGLRATGLLPDGKRPAREY